MAVQGHTGVTTHPSDGANAPLDNIDASPILAVEATTMAPDLGIEVDHEDDRRGLAEVVDLPGVLCCGETEIELLKARATGHGCSLNDEIVAILKWAALVTDLVPNEAGLSTRDARVDQREANIQRLKRQQPPLQLIGRPLHQRGQSINVQ